MRAANAAELPLVTPWPEILAEITEDASPRRLHQSHPVAAEAHMIAEPVIHGVGDLAAAMKSISATIWQATEIAHTVLRESPKELPSINPPRNFSTVGQ